MRFLALPHLPNIKEDEQQEMSNEVLAEDVARSQVAASILDDNPQMAAMPEILKQVRAVEVRRIYDSGIKDPEKILEYVKQSEKLLNSLNVELRGRIKERELAKLNKIDEYEAKRVKEAQRLVEEHLIPIDDEKPRALGDVIIDDFGEPSNVTYGEAMRQLHIISGYDPLKQKHRFLEELMKEVGRRYRVYIPYVNPVDENHVKFGVVLELGWRE
jgi:hypothetical protein